MKNLIPLFLSAFLIFVFSCNQDSDPVNQNQGTTNNAPELPKIPYPPDDTIGIQRLNLTVSWTCNDPDPEDTVKFDIYMANDNPPANILVSGISTRSYLVSYLLAANTLFYWRVVARDNHGATTSGNVWKFTTGS